MRLQYLLELVVFQTVVNSYIAEIVFHTFLSSFDYKFDCIFIQIIACSSPHIYHWQDIVHCRLTLVLQLCYIHLNTMFHVQHPAMKSVFKKKHPEVIFCPSCRAIALSFELAQLQVTNDFLCQIEALSQKEALTHMS